MTRTFIAAAALAAVFAAPAQAALVATGVSCSGHGTTVTADPGFLACSGSWSGNNSNQQASVASQIQHDWGLSGLTATDLSGGIGASSGTLSFADQMGKFVIALKAGNAFSLYEFDGSKVAGGISSIHFDTLGVGFYTGRNIHFGQGLSHATLYAGAVPEPGTLALALAGLGVVGFTARRRRAA
jgi:hypothetical protein